MRITIAKTPSLRRLLSLHGGALFCPGAVNPLTAPRQSRPLLFLGEGLTQLVLLLLRQIGRDDLKVILPELVNDLVRCRSSACECEECRGTLRHLIAHLLDEVIVYP